MHTSSIHTLEGKSIKPSRAQVLRDSVSIRLAVNSAGPLIADILKENGVELNGAQWGQIFPHWLLATNGDDAIGCVQVIPSKPIGYLEFLFVRPSVSFKLRAIALRKLAIQGMATLYHGGAQYVAGIVDTKDKKYLGVIEKSGATPLYTGHLVIKRLA